MKKSRKAFLASLGGEIRRLRDAREWSQMKLAEEAEITQKYLSEIESGKRNPSIDCVRRLSESLGVAIGRLFREA